MSTWWLDVNQRVVSMVCKDCGHPYDAGHICRRLGDTVILIRTVGRLIPLENADP